jgi:aminopeptidase-like protein
MSALAAIIPALDSAALGAELHGGIADLYPICRSITGNGLRESLRYLQRWAPLELREVATGTQVFDWQVPKEWNIHDAYIKDDQGRRVVDFRESSLHVVSYSVPVHKRMRREELESHVHALPDHPAWIPYRTSYYRETWGFCLSHRQWSALPAGEYEVCIDSELKPGHLTYGELFLRGATDDEILISCHSCHPALCNDNLSGMVIAAKLAQLLGGTSRRHSMRFLWIPGTIGAITWLALNESTVGRIRAGLVLSCLGDPGPFHYKKSRRGSAEIDRVVRHLLQASGQPFEELEFTPYGYDERQYCSPGFNLPVGCLMRTPNGQYPEYHTSADNLHLVQPLALAESLRCVLGIVQIIECNQRWLNRAPKCEPQLGRRGLYRNFGGLKDAVTRERAMLWVLNLSDGNHDLLEIAERSGYAATFLASLADELAGHGLLRQADVDCQAR